MKLPITIGFAIIFCLGFASVLVIIGGMLVRVHGL